MSQPSHFPSPEDVESAFYEALAKGDVDALMATWAEDEDIVCVHPTGVRIDDINLVRESWRSIFAASALRVEAELVGHWQGMLLAVHHLTETLYLGDNPEGQGVLHVTHVFARGAHGWRLVNRHASAANDDQEADDMPEPVSHTLH